MDTYNKSKYDNFFEIIDDSRDSALRLEFSNHLHISREVIHELFIGEYYVEKPLVFKGYMGQKVFEWLWATSPLFVISERIHSSFEDAGLTGWKSYPVEVYDRKGGRLPKYYGVSIIGRRVKIDYSKSKLIVDENPIITNPSDFF